MQLTEMRVSGFGGQGVILCASVIGRAASIVENGYATMTQNFGPEARGGACSAQLVLSPKPVLYPYVTRPDLLILMSQESWNKFAQDVRSGGIILIERDMVRVSELAVSDVKVFSIPATRIAEQLGKRVVLNIVMAGFFCAITQVVGHDALRQAVSDSVAPSMVEINQKAFDAGYEFGLQHLSDGALDIAVERVEDEDPASVAE